ncbi:ATP-binding protein [Neobacillus sp. 179-C4.2 HS]|uniref:histidine kinase n=1 Tax=Neobacillus driksii TaxID=3035913 RepID=A0ABV4Z1L9_9BACI|nr:ATP-binding protein [Neobacillus sp. 179.-C4.2 HS]MDP5195239.1 ATP-binding protein [Neobacillus sp. 179.-C4.2 HS]
MDKDEIKRLNFLLEIYVDVNVDKDFSVLSKTTDPFFILSMSGQLVYVNEVCEELLQCSRKDLVGMKLSNIFISSVLSDSQTFFSKKEREQLTNFDSKISMRPGHAMDVNVTAFPILFNDEVVGSYVVLKDITMIKRERQLLSEKQAAAGQLAAGIAHEIRNPITAIKGFMQLMMGEHKGDTTYYNIVESEINRVEMILKELMVLAKPTKINYQELDIRSLLDKVLTLMESQTLLHNIEVIKNFHALEVMIVGDENQLKQVFINYLKNAIEAMPVGGKIIVEGIHLNDSVHIRIIDEGGGIPNEILERISEPFFTTKEHGTGLGMLVCNEIIEEHKGKSNIFSSAEGTCIEVILPSAFQLQ